MAGAENRANFPSNAASKAMLGINTTHPDREVVARVSRTEAVRAQSRRAISLLTLQITPEDSIEGMVDGAIRRNFPALTIPLPDARGTLIIGAQNLEYEIEAETPTSHAGYITVRQQVGHGEDAQLFELVRLSPDSELFFNEDTTPITSDEETDNLLPVVSGIWNYTEEYLFGLRPDLPPAVRSLVETNFAQATEESIQRTEDERDAAIKTQSHRAVAYLQENADVDEITYKNGTRQRHFRPFSKQLPDDRGKLLFSARDLHYLPDAQAPTDLYGFIKAFQEVGEGGERIVYEIFNIMPGASQFIDYGGSSITSPEKNEQLLAIITGLLDYTDGRSLSPTARARIEQLFFCIQEEKRRKGAIEDLTLTGANLFSRYGRVALNINDPLGGKIQSFERFKIPLGSEDERRRLEIEGIGFHYIADSTNILSRGRGLIIATQVIEQPYGQQRQELFRLKPGQGQFLDTQDVPLNAPNAVVDGYIDAAQGVWEFADTYLGGTATAGGGTVFPSSPSNTP